jgi:hypothetical protein
MSPLRRPRCRWDDDDDDDNADDNNTDCRGVGCEDLSWIQLAQDRVQWWKFTDMIMYLLFA